MSKTRLLLIFFLQAAARRPFWVSSMSNAAHYAKHYAPEKYRTAAINGGIARHGDIRYSDLTADNVAEWDYHDILCRWQPRRIALGVEDYQTCPSTHGFSKLSEAVDWIDRMIASGDPRGASYIITTPTRDWNGYGE